MFVDLDEKLVVPVISMVGTDCFFWVSDFLYLDYILNYMEVLGEFIVPLLEEL